MRKVVQELNIMGIIIGIAGLGGAIEFGHGFVASIILIILNAICVVKLEDRKHEKKRIVNNDASYPCYLKK